MPIEILKDWLHGKNGRVEKWVKYFNLETWTVEASWKMEF
jgi:hypothetical protein